MTEVKRRSLSGINVLHQFDDEHMPQPTCFEDCPEDKQKAVLDQMNNDELKQMVKLLAISLRKVGDQFEISAV